RPRATRRAARVVAGPRLDRHRAQARSRRRRRRRPPLRRSHHGRPRRLARRRPARPDRVAGDAVALGARRDRSCRDSRGADRGAGVGARSRRRRRGRACRSPGPLSPGARGG
ncbi:MAG: hypothetical protein ACK53Y_17765, partial [bacterium]